MSLTKV